MPQQHGPDNGRHTAARGKLFLDIEIFTSALSAQKKSALPEPTTKLETILIIEDESLIRRVIAHKLATLGYKVIEASNGTEAVQRAANYVGTIDLVLTDVVMPGMNGREAVEKIRLDRPLIRVLYMSGYPADIMAARGVLESGVSFMDKSEIIEDGLYKQIQNLLAS